MTKEQIKRAYKEAKLGAKEDKLREAFCIMYRYNLVKGSDMMRLQEIIEEDRI